MLIMPGAGQSAGRLGLWLGPVGAPSFVALEELSTLGAVHFSAGGVVDPVRVSAGRLVGPSEAPAPFTPSTSSAARISPTLPTPSPLPTRPGPSTPPSAALPSSQGALERSGPDAAVSETKEPEDADLARWRAQLHDTAPGPDLNQLVEAAPQFTASGQGEDGQLDRAQVDVEFIVACQRQVAYLESLAYERTARLSMDYPGLREFYDFELALALGVSEGTAQTRIGEAARLIEDLPDTLAAMRSGRLSAGKARTLVRCTMHVDAELARAVESVVLPEAPGLTDAELRHRCAELLIQLDPSDAEDRHREARKRRTVKKWNEPDGMANLLVHSTVQDIATIWEAMTGLGQAAQHHAVPGADLSVPSGRPAETGMTSGPSSDSPVWPAGDGGRDVRSLDMCRVDALVDVCADILAGGGWRNVRLADRHARKPHLQVLMPLDALLGGASPCQLTGYGPITARQARVIAADATLTRLVCDPLTGQLLDYGRTRYQPPQHLAEFVLARDQRCIAPGCLLPAHRCQIDHRMPFGRPDGSGTGGCTSAENLAAPCQHHHRAKDGGG